jgi:hypothetical protein
MKQILLILSAALFSSCLTQKKIDKVCARCPIKTEIHDSISYKHDTVKVDVPGKPGPTVYVESPCDSTGKLKSFSVTREKNGMRVTTKSVGNVIVTEAEKKDTTLNIPIATKQTFHSETREVPVCHKEHRNGLDYFCRYWTLGTCILMILIAAVIGIRKFVLKR